MSVSVSVSSRVSASVSVSGRVQLKIISVRLKVTKIRLRRPWIAIAIAESQFNYCVGCHEWLPASPDPT